MSFKRFDNEDIVISADSISSPAWTGNEVRLQNFFTSSAQIDGPTGKYFYDVYNGAADAAASQIQFSIAYGNKDGSGSSALNASVASNSPSSIIYKQYRSLINGSEDIELSFDGTDVTHIYSIAIQRARYKEKLLPGSLTLQLGDLFLTDNSKEVTTQTFTDAGRVFQIISGSAGTKTDSPKDTAAKGNSKSHGSYGLFLPDTGLIILNGKALDAPVSDGGVALASATASVAPAVENMALIYDKLEAPTNGNFTVRSEETVSSNYVFVRARNSEFNYSTNPSNITGSGELRHSSMIDSPQSYITAVGLYNDNNDLLAVSKLSRPLLKDFTKEALVRIKLDY
jgi:hypothetical protein